MSELEVREAGVADRDDLRALCRALDPGDYVADAWDVWRRHDHHLMLVAHAGGRLVGCVHASIVAPGQAFAQALRVDPAAWRHGVATRLMEAQAARLRSLGVDVMRGVTAYTNERARRFFAAIGHRETGVVRRRRLRGWTAGTAATATRDPATGPLLASVEGLAHFRRVVWRVDASWLAAAAGEGRWHAKDGAWALLDPPSREFGTWVAALGGPPDALAGLLRTLSPPWRVDGGMTVEAPDEPAIVQALDELGFAPAPPQDAYVIVEQVLR